MKQFLCALSLFCLTTKGLYAQDANAPADTTKPENPWTYRFASAWTLTNTTFSNWQAGGENTLSSNVLIQSNINYRKGIHTWENLILGNYGLVSQESGTFKTDDRFEINSRYDRKFAPNWNFSGLGNFRTQFVDGFKSVGDTNPPISTFMAPAYGVLALGFTYTREKKFNVFLSPLTIKTTWVRNQRLADLGAFGVTPGERVRYEGGGYLNMIYQNQFLPNKNIDFLTKLDLFSNYFERPQAVDVNWETIIFYRVNKYLTFNIAFHLIYDEDVRFNLDTTGDGIINATNVPRTQFRSLLGFGLSYVFDSKKA
jgi:hypothetical protein